jgi:hypothetical protein
LVSNADAATQQNKFSSNLNIVVMTDAEIVSSTSPGAAESFTICTPQASTCTERSARILQFSLLTARAITHRTLQKAELFCEICMMRKSAVTIA